MEAIALLGPGLLAAKVLGPTADYIGEGIKDWTERGTGNLGRVFAKAGRKLGGRLDEPGGVPPRVLKGILEEGQFAEDELTAEYLGGVLASARTNRARDDRGASLIALVGRLSTYALRAHYVLYAAARPHLVGTEANLGLRTVRTHEARFFFPFTALVAAMDLTNDELFDRQGILSHSVHALVREDLLDPGFRYGRGDHLRERFGAKDFDAAGGLVYSLSAIGVELFCGAHALRGDYFARYKEPWDPPGIDIDVDLGAARRLRDMAEEGMPSSPGDTQDDVS